MTEIPVDINHKVKVWRQVEFILQHLAEMLLVDIIEPMADAHIEAVRGLVKEDAAARNHGVVMLGIEDGRSVAFGLGTVMLFLPISLVQLSDGCFPIDKDSLLGIYFLHTEKRTVGHVVPKDTDLWLPVVHIANHSIHQ